MVQGLPFLSNFIAERFDDRDGGAMREVKQSLGNDADDDKLIFLVVDHLPEGKGTLVVRIPAVNDVVLFIRSEQPGSQSNLVQLEFDVFETKTMIDMVDGQDFRFDEIKSIAERFHVRFTALIDIVNNRYNLL